MSGDVQTNFSDLSCGLWRWCCRGPGVSAGPPALRHWLMIGGIGALWGANFPAVAVALEGFSPLTLAAARASLGAVAVLGLLMLTGNWRARLAAAARPGMRLPVLAVGVFSVGLPYALLAWGMQHVGAGFAGVTMAAVPLLVAPLAHLLVPGERLTRGRVLGVLIGFAGVVVLIGPGLWGASGSALEDAGRLALLAAAGSFAVGAIATRLCPPIDVLALGAASVIVAAVVLVPVALVVEGWPAAISGRVLLALLFLGLATTAGAQLLRIRVTREVGPNFSSLTVYQVPLWALLLSVTFLGETVPPQLALGLVLILGGLGLAGRPDRLLAGVLRRG